MTLVEVLVTLVILAIGLLGLVALQARVQVLQIEAYQRAQALMLMRDMAGRLANNRNSANLYVTGAEAPLGVGMDVCPDPGVERQERDLAEWCVALQGAGETLGGTNVGAMAGGRGCVENPAPGEYLVTVAWQGLIPITAPPAGVSCGQGLYEGAEGTPCSGDRCRRVVTTVVLIPSLTS